jgi:hypothetical protein
VEGMNGEIVQYMLHLVGCERQHAFNNIVNLKQRAMGLLLESEDDSEDSSMRCQIISKVCVVQSSFAYVCRHA